LPLRTCALMMTSLLCLVLSQLDVLPPHLRGGSIGNSQPSPPTIAVSAQYVEVPLDHFDLKLPTWQLKFFVDDTAYGPGGALLVTMPSEGATSECYAGDLRRHLERSPCARSIATLATQSREGTRPLRHWSDT